MRRQQVSSVNSNKWRQTAKRKVMNEKALEKFNNKWLKKKLCGVKGGSDCLLYTSPSPRDGLLSRMPSSA